MEYYFDNSATTRPYGSVISAMTDVMNEFWGNPSSLHSMGYRAEKEITKARESILEALNIRDRKAELIFTASGTEADNLALFGTMHAKEKNKKKKLITTKSEHPAVLQCAQRLENEGYEVVYLPAPKGEIDTEKYINALDNNTVMVSIMTVNNETGALYDIKKLFTIAKSVSPDIVTHTDAVQAFMKIHLSPESLKCDLMTLSAHKIHGPKGIGALYVAPDIIKAKRLSPYILGGGQEKGFRSGTENLPAIIGFAEAVKAGVYPKETADIRQYIIDNLPKEIIPNLPLKSAPHILNVTLPNIKSETMLHFLSAKGIYVSSGSACSSNSSHKNYVLPDFGISDKDADHSIRISLDKNHTAKDADVLIEALTQGLKTLVRTK